MSRNVPEKIAKGEDLDEDDLIYARDHGIALPPEYETELEGGMTQVEPGTTPTPVVSGPAYPQPSRAQTEPGLFLTPDQLDSLAVGQLKQLAEAADIEVSGKKADIISQLSGGSPVSPTEEEDEAEEPA